MAVFTEIPYDEAAAFLRRLGLGKLQAMTACHGGIENTNYFVDTDRDAYVLTLFERLAWEQLPFYLHLMQHLANRGISVPSPAADVEGRILHRLKGKPAAVVGRLRGKSELAPDPGHCGQVGEMLARMHLAGRDYARHQPNPRGLPWWKETVPVLLPYVDEDQRTLLLSELVFQKRVVELPDYAALPRGPVHADLFRDNVLFKGARLSGFLDFYFAGCDTFLFDIGVCLNDWCVELDSGRADAEREAAFLTGYEWVRPLLPEERRLLPALVRAAALRFWVSRLQDHHMPREAAVLKPHDPSHFERVLRQRVSDAAGAHIFFRPSTMRTTEDFYASLRNELENIQAAGLLKLERAITSPQASRVVTADGREVINLCANNYLGLSSHPGVIEAAHAALDARGFGVSGARFICGTQDRHKELEARLSRFLGTEDTILYGSAFDANGGLFETLLGPEDAVISDELNHASIIDGIRLCKARRYRWRHDDLQDLRTQLKAAEEAGARYKLVFTDGVFSMDGTIARLDAIREICDEFGALLGVDDSHATGFLGRTGRGTHEHRGVFGKVDIITGTLGKALGGASGGFTSARADVVHMLRQRSRPYLFSNSLAPMIVGATLKVLDLLEADTQLRDTLEANTRHFRAGLTACGFNLKPGEHPIVPVMLHDAELSQRFARRLLELGVYVTGFFYPVVPKGQARIRVQVSAQHTRAQLDAAVSAFAQAGKELGVIA